MHETQAIDNYYVLLCAHCDKFFVYLLRKGLDFIRFLIDVDFFISFHFGKIEMIEMLLRESFDSLKA